MIVPFLHGCYFPPNIAMSLFRYFFFFLSLFSFQCYCLKALRADPAHISRVDIRQNGGERPSTVKSGRRKYVSHSYGGRLQLARISSRKCRPTYMLSKNVASSKILCRKKISVTKAETRKLSFCCRVKVNLLFCGCYRRAIASKNRNVISPSCILHRYLSIFGIEGNNWNSCSASPN